MLTQKKHALSATLLLFLISLVTISVSSCGRQNKKPSCCTSEAQVLKSRLELLAEKGTMIGHQDALAFGANWRHKENRSDIKEVCGSYPAVFGWDLGSMEIKGAPGWPYPIGIDTVREYILKVDEWGGISTVTAHINNLATGESAWDKTPSVHTILPGGENHALYTGWLDKVAVFFNSLKRPDGELIPIIFRPFHELNGDWFWWGKGNCSTEEFTQLWRFTVDYLKKEKGLTQLLFAYSTDRFHTEEEFMERYPGDDYVDMLGFDIYHHIKDNSNEEFIGIIRNCLTIVSKLAEAKDMPFAITEIGQKNVTDSLWWTNVLYPSIEGFSLSYVLIWRNKILPDDCYAPYTGHPSSSNFIEFKNKSGILFLDSVQE